MDYIVHEVTKSWTRLSDFHYKFIIMCIYNFFFLLDWPLSPTWKGTKSILFINVFLI